MAKWPTSVATDSDLYVAVNALQTTLSGAIDNAVTSITLASTTGFPTAGAVTIDSEVVFYTGVSGAILTGCTRGADGTTAASHSSGVPVGATVIAAHHNLLKDEIEAIETSLNLSASLAVVTSASGRVTTSSVTATELGYLSGVTSAIQTQLGTKAPLASPTFTGTVTIPSPFTLGATSVTVTGTEMNYLAGVTSVIQTQLNAKAPTASPTFTGTVLVADGTVSAPGLSFSGDTDTGIYRIGPNEIGIACNGQVQIDISASGIDLDYLGSAYVQIRSTGTAIKGVNTNTSPAAGFYGEVISSTVSSFTNAPTSTQFGDLTSISLTAGHWMISGLVEWTLNGATTTVVTGGVWQDSGNTTTHQVVGRNRAQCLPPTSATSSTCSIPPYEITLSTTTTFYLKYQSNYSAGTPQAAGSVYAVRIS